MSSNRTLFLAGLLLAILLLAPHPKFGPSAPNAADIESALVEQSHSNPPASAEPSSSFGEDTWIPLPASSVVVQAPEPVRIPSVSEIELQADAAIAVTQRGEILFTRNADTPLPIASISKLMTALVALGKLELSAPVPVTDAAIRTDGDSAKLLSGETLSFHDALLAMLVPSSNDAAVAIVQVTGGADAFVAEMNKSAERMGLQTARFANPHGLSPPGNFASARDVASLLQQAILDPTIAEMLRQQHVRAINTQGFLHEWDSTDALLGRLPGMIAGKTGYTSESKGTLVIAFAPKAAQERREAKNTDITVIIAVLGSADRFTDTEALARWVIGAYQW